MHPRTRRERLVCASTPGAAGRPGSGRRRPPRPTAAAAPLACRRPGSRAPEAAHSALWPRNPHRVQPTPRLTVPASPCIAAGTAARAPWHRSPSPYRTRTCDWPRHPRPLSGARPPPQSSVPAAR
eukprot:scaffold27823_cov129-Isochrysis_galbana.AAC.3